MRKLILFFLLSGMVLLWVKDFVFSGRLQVLLDEHPHPISMNIQYSLGQFYLIGSKYDKAEVCFKKVIDVYPEGSKDVHARFHYASCLEKGFRRQEASKQYELLSKKYPDNPYATIIQRRLQFLRN